MQSGEPGLLALAEDLVELERRVRELHAALGAARAALFPAGVVMPAPPPTVAQTKVAPIPQAPPLPPGLLHPAVEAVRPPEEVRPPTGHEVPDNAA